MMTRKDYIAMSDILKDYAEPLMEDYIYLVNDVANYMAEDNPRFMRDKFLQACGIPV
jgi:hypothetical protein